MTERGRRASRAAVVLAACVSLLAGVAPAGAAGQVTEEQLERHGRAVASIQRRDPQLYGILEETPDLAARFEGAEASRRRFERDIAGTGVSFEEFARVHREIMRDPELKARYERVERALEEAETARGSREAVGQGAEPGSSPAR